MKQILKCLLENLREINAFLFRSCVQPMGNCHILSNGLVAIFLSVCVHIKNDGVDKPVNLVPFSNG